MLSGSLLPRHGASSGCGQRRRSPDMEGKTKVNQSHNTPMEAQGERRYSSYSFTTSALDGVSGQRHAPAALYPGKGSPVPTGQEAGFVPEPVWALYLEEKCSCLCRESNLDRPVVQSVGRHYTDWATSDQEIWRVPANILYRQSRTADSG
jgi:hypothetical protein